MSKLLKIAGGFLATIMIAAGLTACGTPAGMNQAYLVTANVNNLTCSEANVEELQATADFAANVDDKQEQDIKKLNTDGSDLTSLTTALDAKIAECSAATPEAAATETAAEPTADCPAEFVQNPVTYSNNRVNDEFTAQFDAAMTNVANGGETNQELNNLLTGFTVRDARTLAIYSNQIGLHDDPNNWKGLVTEDGSCLSSEGQMLYAMYKGALSASGSVIEQTEAPQDWYNSGSRGENGEFIIGEDMGVRGDTRAIKVTLANGTVAIILVRCGNPVFPAPPAGVPTGPTDNPPPEQPTNPPTVTEMCPWNPSLPKGDPNCVKPKNVQEAPQNTGNLPEQQRPNPLPADPGHAQPVKPADPPPTYQAPTPPPPAPPAPAPNNPAPVPTRDPAPPPPPEPEAPASSAPETGCIVIPGVEPCNP